MVICNAFVITLKIKSVTFSASMLFLFVFRYSMCVFHRHWTWANCRGQGNSLASERARQLFGGRRWPGDGVRQTRWDGKGAELSRSRGRGVRVRGKGKGEGR